MALVPLEPFSLFDPNAARGWLHFGAAAPSGRSLFTIQDDQTLTAWSLSADFQVSRGGQASFSQEWYAPKFQFVGDQLLLWDDNVLAAVDVTRPSQPSVVAELELEGLRSCAVAGERLFVECYLGPSGYGALPWPLSKKGRFEMLLPVTDMETHGSHGVAVGGDVWWATQDGLKVLTEAPWALKSSLRLNNVVGLPLLVSDSRLVVLETYDDGRQAVVFVDLEGTRARKVSAHRKNQVVRGWALSGDRSHLFVVVRAKDRLEFVTFDVAQAKEVEATTLPFSEDDDEVDRTKVIWLGVSESNVAVLSGHGQLWRATWERRTPV